MTGTMFGDCVCGSQLPDPYKVTLINDTGRTIALCWFGSTETIPIASGPNGLTIPNHQQLEKAKFAYEIAQPRPRLRWCPWTVLEIGSTYRIREQCDTLEIRKIA